ncbi:MAG: hypothetical protein HC919_04735 [Oscillatoriales cyanobacterium SM2_2_1]|nr:hypothetical protein [Oscillatoriales cyanobacterium SM2_2_1]
MMRVYEELVVKMDENGNRLEELERREECVAGNTRMIPFQLDDGTGVLNVDPEGSDIETVQVMGEFREHHDNGSFIELGVTSGQPNVTNSPQSGKTLGYRYEEYIVPLGRDLLVLGTAVDRGEKVTVRKPTEPGKKFLITFQDEEVLTESMLKTLRGAKWGMAICLGAGALLTIVGVVTGK